MNELTEQIIEQNKPGLIVFLVFILLSNIAFGLFSTKHRFNKVVVGVSYTLFAVFCAFIAKFYHNFAVLFVIIFIVYILLYAALSKGKILKSLFAVTSYLIFFSFFFGACFLMLFLEGPYAMAIRWTVIMIFFALFECFIYIYSVPKFNKAEKNINKDWLSLFIGNFTFLIIIFMLVFYPYQLNKDNIWHIILYLTCVVFYIFVFMMIINYFSAKDLYGQEVLKSFQLKDLASRDFLTHLYNKNYLAEFKETLINEKAEKRIDQTVIALIDIDKFKEINDTLGHLKGDEILKNVADKLKEVFNEEYYKCFRFGGDEFIVIALNENEQDVEEKMYELKANLKRDLDISISCGFRYVNFKDIDPIETAIKKADKLMYKDKFRHR